MLARLDEIPGVAESRVERSGKRFLLTLDSGADETTIARQALRVLGDEAVVLERKAESDALASRRRGELWVSGVETIQLSREEARVLAARFGEEASREIGLSAEKTRKLAEVIEREVAAAFVRVHGRGDALAALSKEREVIAERVLETCRAFLTDAELEALTDFSVERAREPETPECEPPPASIAPATPPRAFCCLGETFPA